MYTHFRPIYSRSHVASTVTILGHSYFQMFHPALNYNITINETQCYHDWDLRGRDDTQQSARTIKLSSLIYPPAVRANLHCVYRSVNLWVLCAQRMDSCSSGSELYRRTCNEAQVWTMPTTVHIWRHRNIYSTDVGLLVDTYYHVRGTWYQFIHRLASEEPWSLIFLFIVVCSWLNKLRSVLPTSYSLSTGVPRV